MEENNIEDYTKGTIEECIEFAEECGVKGDINGVKRHADFIDITRSISSYELGTEQITRIKNAWVSAYTNSIEESLENAVKFAELNEKENAYKQVQSAVGYALKLYDFKPGKNILQDVSDIILQGSIDVQEALLKAYYTSQHMPQGFELMNREQLGIGQQSKPEKQRFVLRQIIFPIYFKEQEAITKSFVETFLKPYKERGDEVKVATGWMPFYAQE